MNNHSLRLFVQHPKRTWIVCGASLALLLAFGLPLVDQWRSTHLALQELDESIQTVSLRLETLPDLRMEARNRKEVATQIQGIDEKQIPEYRDRILALVRSCQCRMLSSAEGKSTRQPWSDHIEPFDEAKILVSSKDKKPSHELIANSLTFLVEGEMPQIVDLLTKLKELEEFAVPSKLSVQNTGNGKQLKLELEMRFFKLAKTAS